MDSKCIMFPSETFRSQQNPSIVSLLPNAKRNHDHSPKFSAETKRDTKRMNYCILFQNKQFRSVLRTHVKPNMPSHRSRFGFRFCRRDRPDNCGGLIQLAQPTVDCDWWMKSGVADLILRQPLPHPFRPPASPLRPSPTPSKASTRAPSPHSLPHYWRNTPPSDVTTRGVTW